MPYIEREQRYNLVDLIRMYRQYPVWSNPAENAEIMQSMILTWLKISTKDKEKTIDGMVNFMCTWSIKHTHRTFSVPNGWEGKKKYNKFDKEVAYFVRDLLTWVFARNNECYINYERLYGLLSLMEAEFERRGWSVGRPDIKAFFKSEKKYWLNKIGIYEDGAIQRNGDLD